MKKLVGAIFGLFFSLEASSAPYFFATCKSFDPTFSPHYTLELGTLATPNRGNPERAILITKIDHDFGTGHEIETRSFGTAIEAIVDPSSEWNFSWAGENQTAKSLWIKKLPNGVVKGEYNTGFEMKELVCDFRTPWESH